MFAGLSAFPLTPLHDERVDEAAFTRLVARAAAAGVDSITALGSTGAYAYLSVEERRRVAHLAVEHAGNVPVIVGAGALRTRDVLELTAHAEAIGAAGVLVAPLSYQALTHDDVYGLFEDVTASTALPVIVYDNPGTTRFTFDDDLYRSIAALPGIASIKIPGVPTAAEAASSRVAELRALVPEQVSIGVSGDVSAATGLSAGCDAWYSVIAGTLPAPATAITRAALAGDTDAARALSDELAPLWALFAEHGSFRVVAAIAEHLDLVSPDSLPRPIRGLDVAGRRQVAETIEALELRP